MIFKKTLLLSTGLCGFGAIVAYFFLNKFENSFETKSKISFSPIEIEQIKQAREDEKRINFAKQEDKKVLRRNGADANAE